MSTISRLTRPALAAVLALLWAGGASAAPVTFTFVSNAIAGGAFASTQTYTPALPFSGTGVVDEAAGTFSVSLPDFTVVIDVLVLTPGAEASVLTTGWGQTGTFAGGVGGAVTSSSATGTNTCTDLNGSGYLVCAGVPATVAPWPPTGAAGTFGAPGATISLADGVGYDGTITVNNANDPNGGQVQSIYTYSILPDADGDDVADGSDNCPYTSNPTQLDSGGVNTAVPDGIGDACQCGDTNNSGTVTATDATVLSRAIAGLSPFFSVASGLGGGGPGLDKCNVGGSPSPGVGGCTASDATVIKRALALLGPGIAQNCDAALP